MTVQLHFTATGPVAVPVLAMGSTAFLATTFHNHEGFFLLLFIIRRAGWACCQMLNKATYLTWSVRPS